MSRRPVVVNEDTTTALLGSVAAGSSLSAACRDHGIKRSTAADRFSEPSLAARLAEARAAGKGVRASRPRRRAIAAQFAGGQGEPAAPVPPLPLTDAPTGDQVASLQVSAPRCQRDAAAGSVSV
jgi:hypothetical protein